MSVTVLSMSSKGRVSCSRVPAAGSDADSCEMSEFKAQITKMGWSSDPSPAIAL